MSLYTGAKWGSSTFGTPGGTVTWSFAALSGTMMDFAGPISEAAYQTAVRHAFGVWDAIADIDFVEVADSHSTEIRIGWATIDGVGAILAEAYWTYSGGSIRQSEIRFDLAENWRATATKKWGEIDFTTVALHEIGHAIGLHHSDDRTSVMYASGGAYKPQSDGDTAAIIALYGAEQPANLLPPGFAPLDYIASYDDLVRAFGMNAQAGETHYLRHGHAEGRAVTFDGLEYSASYADLIRAFGSNPGAATAHFFAHGHAEGRKVVFNGLEYIASHEDLVRAFGADARAGAKHYIEHGLREGRATSFDGLEYIASHADLRAQLGVDADAGAAHFISVGRAGGRDTSFDALQYIATHDDLIRAFGPDARRGAEHFIRHGEGEGRSQDDFDADQYLENYADLRAAFGTDTHAATHHYIEHGFFELRTDEFVFDV